MSSVIALGEVMLRLDPGAGRIRAARSFDINVGGGEFNVAAGLTSLGHDSAVIAALPNTEVGALVASLVRHAGVSTHLLAWTEDDGTGGASRVGLNFTERGYGVRAPLGVSDRAGSATARMQPGDVDWELIFGTGAVRWLHTGGIFAALSPGTADLAAEAAAAARRAGVMVSFDMNFRPSLQRAIRDRDRYALTMRRILNQVDVLFSNEPEYLLSIGEPAREGDAPIQERFTQMVEHLRNNFPGVRVAAATARSAHSTSRSDWAGHAWSEETGVITSTKRRELEIYDRVGGGDAFAAGVIHGLLDDAPLLRALELGVAHGALVMTTPGDGSLATSEEVKALANGGELRTLR